MIGIGIVALVFIAGMAVGAATDHLLVPRSENDPRVVQDMPHVLDQLGLTQQQRHQADVILAQSAPRSERTMLDLASRLRDISDSVDTQLRLILTPAQRVKLDSLRHPPTFILKRDDRRGGVSIDTILPPR